MTYIWHRNDEHDCHSAFVTYICKIQSISLSQLDTRYNSSFGSSENILLTTLVGYKREGGFH